MEFAIGVLRLVDQLPRTSRSRAEFIAKLGVVVEEAEETTFWLELIERSHMLEPATLRQLRLEASALLAIFAKSVGTARVNNRAHSHKQPGGQLGQMTR